MKMKILERVELIIKRFRKLYFLYSVFYIYLTIDARVGSSESESSELSVFSSFTSRFVRVLLRFLCL
jgi:hypothetical protein